ncbi:TORTIFOLIA1-like protein 4 [Aristolochia californica]|uniref:TORTIFOLIA1-like protein 4 n=1 Tax=Aristolochia californica TaxID=171875 RepID=UPI0035E3A5D9
MPEASSNARSSFLSLAMAASKPSQKRSTRSSSPAADLKYRTISCLNKLSDRDTFTIASTELEAIALTLTPDSFSPFLSCIYDTDSSHKSPVRKQCVRLFSTLAVAHENALSPFIPKMLQNVLRRLRDPDSAVRSACVDTISTVASRVTKLPFSVFLKPFSEAILIEQDYNLQIGAAMCLAAAVEAAPDSDPAQLQRILLRFFKLLKCDSFKAKPALISLIGSIVSVGGSRSGSLLGVLVPCLVDFLSSEDWAARKAAAEALLKVAVAERDLVGEFKDSCLTVFEARRFDKIKAVRETMKQMIDAWKDVRAVPLSVASQPDQSRSSSRENASDGHFASGLQSSSTIKTDSLSKERRYSSTNRSPPPLVGNASTTNGRKNGERRVISPLYQKVDRNKPTDWKIEIAIPHDSPLKVICEDNHQSGMRRDSQVIEQRDSNSRVQPEVKRDKNCDEKTRRFGGLRSQSRVVPLYDRESPESTGVVSNVMEGSQESQKAGDLSLIREQLVQIENQQLSLLDLLQKFIGTSQNGMRSLETRVHGLEIALDEISHDLAVSTARMTNSDTEENICCKLPGADFLSSKFWRRVETGRCSSSRFPSSGVLQSAGDSYMLENRRFRSRGGFVVNPLAEVHSQSITSSEVCSNRTPASLVSHETGRRHASDGVRVPEVAPVT